MLKDARFFSKARIVLVLGSALLFPITSCNNLEEAKPAAVTNASKQASYKDVADAFSYAMGRSNVSSGARLSAVNSVPQSHEELEARMLDYLVYIHGEAFETQYKEFRDGSYMQNLNAIIRSEDYATGDDRLAAVIETAQASNHAQVALQGFADRMHTHLESYDENESVTKEQLTANFTQEIEALKEEVVSSWDMPENEKEALMSVIYAQLAEGLGKFTTVSNEVSLAYDISNELLNGDESAAPGGRLSAAQKTWFGKFIVVAGNFVVNVAITTFAALSIVSDRSSSGNALALFTSGFIASAVYLFLPWDKQFWWH